MFTQHNSPPTRTCTVATTAVDGTLIAVSAPLDDGVAIREAHLVIFERVRQHEDYYRSLLGDEYARNPVEALRAYLERAAA